MRTKSQLGWLNLPHLPPSPLSNAIQQKLLLGPEASRLVNRVFAVPCLEQSTAARHIRTVSVSLIRSCLKTHLFRRCFPWLCCCAWEVTLSFSDTLIVFSFLLTYSSLAMRWVLSFGLETEMEPGQANWPGTRPDPVTLDPVTRDPTRSGWKIFTNVSCWYTDPVILPAVMNSDHFSVIYSPNHCLPRTKGQYRSYYRRSTDPNAKAMLCMHALQRFNWTPLYRMNSIHTQVHYFYTTLTGCWTITYRT